MKLIYLNSLMLVDSINKHGGIHIRKRPNLDGQLRLKCTAPAEYDVF